MSAGPIEGDAYSEEGLNPYPDVDPHAQAEEEIAAAQRDEEDALAIEADRQNALADPTRGDGPQQLGDILRPTVDALMHGKPDQNTTGA